MIVHVCNRRIGILSQCAYHVVVAGDRQANIKCCWEKVLCTATGVAPVRPGVGESGLIA